MKSLLLASTVLVALTNSSLFAQQSKRNPKPTASATASFVDLSDADVHIDLQLDEIEKAIHVASKDLEKLSAVLAKNHPHVKAVRKRIEELKKIHHSASANKSRRAEALLESLIVELKNSRFLEKSPKRDQVWKACEILRDAIQYERRQEHIELQKKKEAESKKLERMQKAVVDTKLKLLSNLELTKRKNDEIAKQRTEAFEKMLRNHHQKFAEMIHSQSNKSTDKQLVQRVEKIEGQIGEIHQLLKKLVEDKDE